MKSTRFADILRLLAENEVEVVVVGMLAGVLQGAPLTTGDVDVVHRRTPQNVTRLLRVLEQIAAVYRHDPRRLVPTESHLLGPGHQLLETTPMRT
jgi:uridylate kinase